MTRALIGVALVLTGLAGPAFAPEQPDQSRLEGSTQGKPIGFATLAPTANGVSIALDLKGLPAGEHAVHIHTDAQV